VDIFDEEAEAKFARLRGVIKKSPREARVVWFGDDLNTVLCDIEDQEDDAKNYEMRRKAREDTGLPILPKFNLYDVYQMAETITHSNIEIDRRAIEIVYDRTKSRALHWGTPVMIGPTAIDCLNGSWLLIENYLPTSWDEGFRKAAARFGADVTLGELAGRDV